MSPFGAVLTLFPFIVTIVALAAGILLFTRLRMRPDVVRAIGIVLASFGAIGLFVVLYIFVIPSLMMTIAGM